MFGSYWRMFEKGKDGVPGYLPLLHLRREAASESLAIIAKALAEDTVPSRQIIELLEEGNWRAQLVGAVAVALHGPSDESVQALWAAIDRGSWVSPQLVAAASLVDPLFEGRAKEHIEGISDVPARPPLRDADTLPSQAEIARAHKALQRAIAERPSEVAQAPRDQMDQGPESDFETRAKTVAALLAILAKTQPDWAQGELARPEIGRLLEYQDEDFGSFVIDWLGDLERLARSSGHPLHEVKRLQA
jgi:hypothetical protein